MQITEPKKIIAVIGSTGAQGGGLVRAILDDKDSPFSVRALTRNPNKESAKVLSQAGADVVAFDMDGDVIEMSKALKGVYGLFVVTNYWEHFDQERESKQAQAVIRAGEIAGVGHYVWSTLDDTSKFFDNKLPEDQRPPKIDGMYVPFFDMKTQTNQYFPKDKTTMLYTSAYLEDFYNGWVSNGTFTANLDDAKLPVIAAEDIGKSTYGIFKAGNEYLGKEVHLATACMTAKELTKIATDTIGTKFTYKNVDHTMYRKRQDLGRAAPLYANMFEYMRLNPGYSKSLSTGETEKLTSGTLISVRKWFEENKDKMLQVAASAEA